MGISLSTAYRHVSRPAPRTVQATAPRPKVRAVAGLRRALAEVWHAPVKPCTSDPVAWTDPPDVRAREAAAEACTHCPALDPCGTVVAAFRPQAVVQAGRWHPPR